MNVFSLIGIALIAFAAIEILGKEQQRIGLLAGAAGVICLFVPGVLSLVGLMDEFKELMTRFEFFGGDLLFRSFGIGLCCEVTGSILRDAGRQGLANALDFSCKAAILLLCVPLWKQLFSLVQELIS